MSYESRMLIPQRSAHRVRVDLGSDTATRPTAGMRAAMAAAEVGDEQRGEDPSTSALVEEVAALLGKEAAVFLPSGTMCNQIALTVHCRPGDEVLTDERSHVLHHEGAGAAALAGALVSPVASSRGVFTAEALEASIRRPGRQAPRTVLVSVEQTSNMGGGTCWTLDELAAVTAVAQKHRLRCHLDGARLMNAVIATGVAAKLQCAAFDSAWIDLSKGLGAPVGAVLAGESAFIEEAWRLKQRWGGAMRQSGVLAAAGRYALRHHVERLAEDHENARVLAAALADHKRLRVDASQVQTNIVMIELIDLAVSADDVAARLQAERGVRLVAIGPRTLRAVTHLDVDASQISYAATATLAVLDELADAGC